MGGASTGRRFRLLPTFQRACRSFSTSTTPPVVSRVKVNSPVQSSLDDQDSLRVPFPKQQVRTIPDVTNQTSVESLDDELASWSWLGDHGPRYSTHGSKVKVLRTPQEYYDTLTKKSKSATHRITLASLYLGNGPLEQELVSILKTRLEQVPSLEINIVLDYTRGSRGHQSSRSMLRPLTSSSSCQVFLYHTPKLRGVRKKLLPPKWNELVGLQHMKVYVFDDSVLITGANLSNDYFTNRQDRYVLIEDCPALANFYHGLITTLAKLSFRLDSSDNLHLHPGWTINPVTGPVQEFKTAARQSILDYYHHVRTRQEKVSSLEDHQPSDTWIFPLIQMGPFGISCDEEATLRLFRLAGPSKSRIKLATGYFNLTPKYVQAIVSKPGASFEILMAHPQANGFFGAKFPAGGIPAAYTLLAKRFMTEVQKSANTKISMYEYFRTGWTFHSKGLWLYPDQNPLPILTLVGSPNFGFRSVYRDLETQLYIVTTNEGLRKDLESEQKTLFSYGDRFEPGTWNRDDRRVPLWVRVVIRFFKNFF